MSVNRHFQRVQKSSRMKEVMIFFLKESVQQNHLDLLNKSESVVEDVLVKYNVSQLALLRSPRIADLISSEGLFCST